MVGLHELTVEEVLWLMRMSRGRLLKDPLELGMPEHVRSSLLAKGLAVWQGGLLEITVEGLAETIRRGEPPTQDALADRAPVLLVVSPFSADQPPSETGPALERQKKISSSLLHIAIDAAIIDHEASKLNADYAAQVPPPMTTLLDPDASEHA